MESDRLYFERRAEQERAAAASADHEQARKAHLELATRYEDMAAAMERHELGADQPLARSA